MTSWLDVARCVADDLAISPGQAITLRDRAGRPDALAALTDAIRARGATVAVESMTNEELLEILVDDDRMSDWLEERRATAADTDAVVVLTGLALNECTDDRGLLALWDDARAVIDGTAEARGVPLLLAATPTHDLAMTLGVSLADLDRQVLPSLVTPPSDLARLARAYIEMLESDPLVLETPGCSLELRRGTRPWLVDDGALSDEDRQARATVVNLPAGVIYATVLEEATYGSVRLYDLAGVSDVVLTFAEGRVEGIEAAGGADPIHRLFAEHVGEPRRVAYVSIGINAALDRRLGWPLVDEHQAGAVLLSLGDNLYLGGANGSSLNADAIAVMPRLRAGGQTIVSEGRLVTI
jgi:leucyl aminopeptidase (aminopeptidase T)